jgi:hypothetical protein
LEIANIYDNGPISPVAKIKENLAIWTDGRWQYFNIGYCEPIPRSSPTSVDLVATAGATTLAAGGTLAQQVVQILQLNTNEFMQVRFEPREDVEGILWEQPSQGRFHARRLHARVSRYTCLRDPYLATTTFFIMGKERDMNLEVRNLSTVYALPQARFNFWGFRYLVNDLTAGKNIQPVDQNKLNIGDISTVSRIIGPCTWLPAEGQQG